MNGTKNLARDGKLRIFEYFPSLVGGLQQQSVYLSTANILLSLTAFLGNSVILVALHKESCLHPPSKLLYRCLATTDLLVGLVCQPLHAAYWMSVSYEHWNLCRFAYDTFSVSAYALCSVSLLTMTAISVDRLLALLLGLRYRELVTLKRTYIIVATFWVLSGFTALSYPLDHRIATWNSILFIPSCLPSHWSRTQRFSARLVIIRLKYKITSNSSRTNQTHWTWRSTGGQCTVPCGCS